MAYHVTQRANLESIMKLGLIPKTPLDYQTGGDIKGVYLFKNYSDVENALSNWLGDRFDKWEEDNNRIYDEIILEVDIQGLESTLIDSVKYEYISKICIDPKRIRKLTDIDLLSL